MVVVLVVVCCCMLLVGCGLLNVVVCCMLLGCCAGWMIQPVHSVHPLQLLSAKIVDGREKMDQLSKNLTAGKKIDSWSTPSTMLVIFTHHKKITTIESILLFRCLLKTTFM